jgi:transposase-like protein
MPNPGKLSATDWATICTLAERGEKTVRELAQQFDVSDEAIRKGLKKRGIVRRSKQGEVMGEAVDEARVAREAAVKAANQQVETYSKYNDVIAKLTMKRIIEGDRDGNLATKNAEILVLKNAAAIVEKARQEQWDIQGIEDLLGENAELPDLNVGEYTPEELEAIREANEDHYNESMRSSADDDDVIEDEAEGEGSDPDEE